MQRMVTLQRWKLAIAVVVTLVVGLALGFLVERARLSNTATTTVPTPTASPTLLPTPSPTAMPTPTPTPTAVPATPAPTLAAPPPVGNGGSVVNQSGSGNNTTPLPQLNDNWGFAYSFLCNGSGRFNVTVLSGSGQSITADPPFAVDGSVVQGVQQFAKGGSNLELRISTDGGCQWRFTVYSG